tara:strand:- start:1 stop:207 length:207 start_codon:yes stop_codon:yes gene_type:complete
MYYAFKKDTRVWHFTCDDSTTINTDTHVAVWVEDPSTVDMKYLWTLDTDDKTLIKGAESHAGLLTSEE